MSREPTRNDNEGKHIASLTQSQMLVLNLPELQTMGIFSAEIALIDQSEPRIYAYEHQQTPNCYLLLVPISFLEATKNSTSSFVELLCLCSQTVTVPSLSPQQLQVESLLRNFRVGWREKRGSNVSKLYLQGECLLSYLDFVTFQAVQFKNSREQLLANKKENAFGYCLNSFKEELLPFLYRNQEESIEQALQLCTRELKSMFTLLECSVRFEWLYVQLNSSSTATLRQLTSQIQLAATTRKITTIGDEQCEELVNIELSNIANCEFWLNEPQLQRLKDKEQVVFLTKIMNTLLMKLRELEFEVNDQKFLFLNQKVIEKVYEMHRGKIFRVQNCNKDLEGKLDQKDREIEQKDREIDQRDREIEQRDKEIEALKQELEAFKAKNVTPKKQIPKLDIITEQPEEHSTASTRRGLSDLAESMPKGKVAPLTLKDVKEPLQVITPGQTNKLQKSGLGKAKQKLREGLKKQQDVRRQRSGKLLKMLQ